MTLLLTLSILLAWARLTWCDVARPASGVHGQVHLFRWNENSTACLGSDGLGKKGTHSGATFSIVRTCL